MHKDARRADGAAGRRKQASESRNEPQPRRPLARSYHLMQVDEPIPLKKTITFILIVVVANSFGNILLAEGMNHMPSFQHVPMAHYVLRLLANPWVLPGALLTAVYTLAQLSLFSWADLSYVIPCTAASYIVTTLLGRFLMGEHVAPGRWVGVLLITLGVVLVAETPTRTKREEAPRC